MTEEKALVQFNLSDTMSLGKVLAESGFFSDTKQAAQAVVKVLAGREMGFGPIASMTGVHIVQGKPTIGANLLGAAIKGSGRYDYRVIELTNDRAEIAFFQGQTEIGRSVFTMQDAQVAGLTSNPTWKKYPKNMLFSRAMSNGARWYCPDVFSGVTPYTPEELGAEVDGETGEVVDVTPTRVPERKSYQGTIGAAEEELERMVDEVSSGTIGILNPKELYEFVADLEYYHSIPHMLNTLRKLRGDDKLSWPAGDPHWYDDAVAELRDYAKANKAQEVVKATAQKMDL